MEELRKLLAESYFYSSLTQTQNATQTPPTTITTDISTRMEGIAGVILHINLHILFGVEINGRMLVQCAQVLRFDP